MTKASIYVRVSTGAQDTANQLSVLKDWAKGRGFEIIRVYSEEESGLESWSPTGAYSPVTGQQKA